MAITVNVQNNPLVPKTGQFQADTTIISSGEGSGTIVTYDIRKQDGSESFRVSSNTNVANFPQVDSVDTTSLKIHLRERTKYRVRTLVGGVTSGWVKFKTRDKHYRTPDAITQLSDNTDDTPVYTANRRIVVTNTAKANVVDTGKNATVTVTGNNGNGTTVINTARGATVTQN